MIYSLGEVNSNSHCLTIVSLSFITPMVVLTDMSLEYILSHPEATERLIKWVIELNEYDIDYQPHSAIKAQALTNFLMEITRIEDQ